MEVFEWSTAEQQEECEYGFVNDLVADCIFDDAHTITYRERQSVWQYRSSTAESREGAAGTCGVIESRYHLCAAIRDGAVFAMTTSSVWRSAPQLPAVRKDDRKRSYVDYGQLTWGMLLSAPKHGRETAVVFWTFE
jgi:hypothetical protein